MSTLTPARTYNQNHIARKYTPGKRRLSIYWTWSYPWESQRDPAAMENRFSTMTEVRSVLWPSLRDAGVECMRNSFRGSPARWNFFTVPRSASSKLPVKQLATRLPCSSASTRRVTSCRLTNGFWQTPTRSWCSDSTTSFPNRRRRQKRSQRYASGSSAKAPACCLRRITMSASPSDLQAAADGIPPSRRRARAAPAALRAIYPLADEGARRSCAQYLWGLRPALVKGTKEIAPLTAFRDLDKLGLLNNVPTLNFHPHLPHYEITDKGQQVDAICWRANPSIPTARIPSPQPATRSSIVCSGCRQISSVLETSC